MFDGETYSAYVMGAAVAAVRQTLSAWPRTQVRKATIEEIVERLYRQVVVLSVSYDDEDSGWEWKNPDVPTEGGRVKLRVDVRSNADADRFFSMTPTNRAGSTGSANPELPYIVIKGIAASHAVAALDALKANIDALNRDLADQDVALREHIRNVVEARVREIDKEESAAAREVEALEESGLRVLNPPSSDGDRSDRSEDDPPDGGDVGVPAISAVASLYVVAGEAERREALDLVEELRRIARAAVDTGDLNAAGAHLGEEEMLPLIDELHRPLSPESSSAEARGCPGARRGRCGDRKLPDVRGRRPVARDAVRRPAR